MPSPGSIYCGPGSVVPTRWGDPPVGTQDCLPLDALYAPDNLILTVTSTSDHN